MRYHALAVDYDGTIAHNGKVDRTTLAALKRVRDSGRKLLLVTGRELDELLDIFPGLELFDRAVVENGALLYRPHTKEEMILGEAPPERLVEELRRRKVEPLSVGRSIVATWEPHETTVLEVIRELGLEWHIIFNKGAVMALPSSVNKGIGLSHALDELRLSPHNTVGIGDAENDHAFLSLCECAVAVDNALGSVKERADIVTNGERGAGVAELCERLVERDLSTAASAMRRHDVLLGTADDGAEVFLKPYGMSVLVAGPSGSGKSTATTGVLERLAELGYQFCLIDPEGDYEDFAGAVTLGNAKLAPNPDEALQLLEQPDRSIVVNLLGVKLNDRPGFFTTLLPRLVELRAKTGRPHWIVVDEAHHLLPKEWKPAGESLPKELGELLLVTVHPDWVSPVILSAVNVILAVGESPGKTLRGYAKAAGYKPPAGRAPTLKPGEVLAWFRTDRAAGREKPFKVAVTPAQAERRRHQRKYAEGELIADEHFWFRGPDNRLQLRAQNLIVFMQMGEGVDDDTWDYHLRRGDYTNWFRHVIKDDQLADIAEHIQADKKLSPKKSRAMIRDEIEKRYTLPA